MKPSELNFEHINLKTTGLSQSKFTLFMQCPMKFAFAMNKLEKPGSEANFFFGTLVHEVLDFCYTHGMYDFDGVERYLKEFIEKQKTAGKLDWCDEQALEEYIGLTLVTMEEYFNYYENDFEELDFYKVEEVFEQNFKNVKITGKIDARFYKEKDGVKKKFLMEHKTKSRISEDGIANRLPNDFQNQYYILADYLETGEWADETLYNVIRKSALKKRANDNLKTYLDRVQKDIKKRPEFYFMRWEVPYTKETLIEFRADLAIDFCHLRRLVSGKNRITRNRTACEAGGFMCPYINNCTNNDLDGLIEKPTLNPELED